MNIEISCLTYDIKENTATVISCKKDAETVEIQSAIESEGKRYPVVEIGKKAFNGCEHIKEVVIPDSVISIGERTFFDCISLTEINIPDSVISIGKSAFSFCESLKKITIPDSVSSIGDSAFYRCKSLNEISIPDSVKSIRKFIFYGCDSLKKAFVSKKTVFSKRTFPEHTEIIRQ